MRTRWLCASMAVVAVCAGLQTLPAWQPRNADPAAEASVSAEEQIVRDSVKLFLDAYSARDAKAIGELFTPDAEYYDELGEVTTGRDGIVALFESIFEASTSSIDDIQVQRVRRIDENVLLEEGLTTASDGESGTRQTTRYIALHNRGADGKWRIGSLKEVAQEAGSRSDQLSQLSWMLGDWVNQDRDSVVHTHCDWSADGNYLLRNFVVESRNGGELDGVQRIGWDASIKKIRSWAFDSEGGYVEGIWTRDGASWLVASRGVSADGSSLSGTAVYTIVDDEMIIWRYRDLIVDNKVHGDTPAVTMVRHPPEPKAEAN